MKSEPESSPEEDFKKLQGLIRDAYATIESETALPIEKNEIAKGFIAEIIKTGLDGKEFDILY